MPLPVAGGINLRGVALAGRAWNFAALEDTHQQQKNQPDDDDANDDESPDLSARLREVIVIPIPEVGIIWIWRYRTNRSRH